MNFVMSDCNASEHRFLSNIEGFFTEDQVSVMYDSSEGEFSRVAWNGLWTLIGKVGNQSVGLIYGDFRLNGGSFGNENSKRMAHFLEVCGQKSIPVLFVINSLGVRIMEGRTVFNNAFKLIPAILKFQERNLFVTLAKGRCLGLGALIYGMGHYRMAVAESTHINLTGPEVLKLFFGQKFDFDEFTSVERQVKSNDLIHEVSPTLAAAFRKSRIILAQSTSRQRMLEIDSDMIPVDLSASLAPVGTPQFKMHALLNQIGASRVELFVQMSSVVKIFLIERGNKKIGVFINPPGNPNNMITIEALQKYSAGLSFFKQLGIPVLSMLDSPGADPRASQSDRNNIKLILEVGEKIINYPYGTMGIVAQRSFGGATTLCFPKNFNSRYVFALKGSKLGIMHESIITQILGNGRAAEQWAEVSKTQTDDLQDLIDQGSIDGIIDEKEIGKVVDTFLVECSQVLGHASRMYIAPRRGRLNKPIKRNRNILPRRRAVTQKSSMIQ